LEAGIYAFDSFLDSGSLIKACRDRFRGNDMAIIENKLPRRKQRSILRHAGLDPASSSVSGFRRPPE
jgi:hypothetical protein